MKNPFVPFAPRAAFTLIELLTVIAIIGILAAILIPTVGKVRDTAQQAKTTSNLRQLYQGNKLHANEFKGLYVPAVANSLAGNGTNPAQWYNNPIFAAYVANDKLNAFEDRENVFHSGKPNANNGAATSLGISIGFQPSPRNLCLKESDVYAKFPRMIMFADARNWMIAGKNTKDSAPDSWDDSASSTGFGQIAYRHSSKANAVLGNGAVVRMTKADMVSDENFDQLFPTVGNGATRIKGHTSPY